MYKIGHRSLFLPFWKVSPCTIQRTTSKEYFSWEKIFCSVSISGHHWHLAIFSDHIGHHSTWSFVYFSSLRKHISPIQMSTKFPTSMQWLVVAQLVERLPLTPQVRGSNPAISKIYIERLLSTVLKVYKQKRGRERPI